MTLPYGTRVLSRRHAQSGIIVGYGVVQWCGTEGDTEPQPVYLVQVSRGSSALGPACAVWRADQVEAS